MPPPSASSVVSLADQRLLEAALETQARAHREATAIAHRLTAAAKGGARSTAQALREMAASLVPRWHFPMLNDVGRNTAFATALRHTVRPGDHVLDIGSGTGLLAMMAAEAGAASVTTCEANPVLAEIARQAIAANGLADVVTVLAKRSDELVVGVDFPRRADLVVSEIVDCGLIGEGVLPTIRHARRSLLAPAGTLLPAAARLLGCLVDSAVLTRLNRVEEAHGYDVSALNRLATPGHFPVRLHTWPHCLLTEPVELVRFDFVRDSLEDGEREVVFPAQADGVAHGVVVWFEMDLGVGVSLHNAPEHIRTHWMQAFVPLDQPQPVFAGQVLALTVQWQDERLTVSFPTPTL